MIYHSVQWWKLVLLLSDATGNCNRPVPFVAEESSLSSLQNFQQNSSTTRFSLSSPEKSPVRAEPYV